MLEELKEQMNMMLDMSKDMTPKIAKLYKQMYDELVVAGFTEEQAMEIVVKYNPTGR